MNESRGNLGQQTGFTIIEILIVLATIGLMVAVLFLAAPSLQKSQRDSARREVARKTHTALLEFYNRNQRFPACDSGVGDPCDSGDLDDASRFIMSYLPQDRDPTTGESFSSSALTSGSGLIHTSSNSALYVYDSTQVNHSYKPPLGQIYIGSGHWCYSTRPDDGPQTNPIASNSVSGGDRMLNRFVILIGLEKGEYFCIDNY